MDYISLFKKRIDFYESSTSNKKGLYFQFYTELVKMYELYGLKTCLLYQVGKFFESYGFEDEFGTFGNYKDIAKLTLLKIVYGDRQATYSSPQYIGFQTDFEEKYIDVLIRNGYTVAVYIQSNKNGSNSGENTFNKENGIRILRNIISPSTYIDSILEYSAASKNIIALYIEGITSKSELEKFQFVCGCAIIDVSTGETLISELSNGTKGSTDKKIIDDTHRIFSIFKPLEVIIYYDSLKFNVGIADFFKNYIGNLFPIEKCVVSQLPKKYISEPHQTLILNKSYLCNGALNIFDFLGITKFHFATIALTTLIDYLSGHNSFLIKNLKIPKIYDSQNRLILENDALYQLSIISKNDSTSKSLIDIINKTLTPMGYRELYATLTKPFTDPDLIKNRLDCITFFINFKNEDLTNFTNIITSLKKVGDIQRLQRRIFFKNLKIDELYKLHSYYEYLIKVFNILISKKKPKLLKIKKDFITTFKSFIKEYIKIFDSENFVKIKNGVDPKYDEIISGISMNKALIEEIYNFLRTVITDTKMKSYIKIGSEPSGKIKITVTKTITTQIKKLNLPQKYTDKKSVDYLEFVAKGNTFKVKSVSLKNANRDLLILEEELKKKTKEIYDSLLNRLAEYDEFLSRLCEFIGLIDISISGALSALEYGYNRPLIISKNDLSIDRSIDESPLCGAVASRQSLRSISYFKVKKIRHPIIERLIKERYVSNDVELSGNDSMLLISINAAGKSSLMRACALNIIMAQSGMYVAAEYFELNPYYNIFTRIDVIESFYYSRFEMECLDIKSIYNRSGPNTFVLLDELVSSTELNSALSISYAMCYFLREYKATFIFATHLNTLYELIKKYNSQSQEGITLYHLSIDVQDDKVLYTRKLQKGTIDHLYGIEVAKNIIGADTSLIKEAFKFRNYLTVVKPKKSKYNKNILLTSCDVCGSKEDLEVHHILEQHTATNDNLVSNKEGDFSSKNDISNLCVLCRECHTKNHQSEQKIDGWKKDVKNGKHILTKK